MSDVTTIQSSDPGIEGFVEKMRARREAEAAQPVTEASAPEQDESVVDETQPVATEAGEPNEEPTEDAKEEEEVPSEPEAYELPIKDADGNPIKATLEDLNEWRLNGLRQADYSRNMNQLTSERKSLEAQRAQEAQTNAQVTADYVDRLQRLHATAHAVMMPELQNVNWMQLAQDDPVKYVQLEAKAKNFERLEQSFNAEYKRIKEQREQAEQSAKPTVSEADLDKAAAELARDVPGWNDQYYQKLMRDLVDRGFDAQQVATQIDPKVWKLVHESYQYRQLKNGVAKTKETLKAAPKLVLKSGSMGTVKSAESSASKQAKEAFKKSGDPRDYANYIAAQRTLARARA